MELQFWHPSLFAALYLALIKPPLQMWITHGYQPGSGPDALAALFQLLSYVPQAMSLWGTVIIVQLTFNQLTLQEFHFLKVG
jgi:hypothetical protein